MRRSVVDHFENEAASASPLGTLSTTFQATYYGAGKVEYQFGDFDDGLTNLIYIYDLECASNKVYMVLRLKEVTWSLLSDPFTIAGTVDPTEFESYLRIGGTNRSDPARGIYSPAYLDMPAAGTAYELNNFDTKLVISGEDSNFLPPKRANRIYHFSYMIKFEAPNNQFWIEKQIFCFTVDLYPDLASFQ